MALVGRLAPETTEAERLEGLLRAQAHLHALGVTAWQDAIIGEHGDGGDPSGAYRAADEAGLLTARVVGALWWDRDAGLEQVPDLVARRDALSTPGFRATTVKIMQDGVPENFTAAMLDPYCDGHGRSTDNAGISFVPVETLGPAAVALDAAGFQLHFHAIGDRAVRECLDAVEAALRANGRRDARHHLAHLQVVHPDDVARFRDLGVVATIQAFWAVLEAQMVELTLPFLGEPRASWQYPFGDLQRSGAVLAMGSDWAVSTADPLAAIHVAVNRTVPDGYRDGEPEHPGIPPRAAHRPRHRAHGVHRRVRVREPPRRHRDDPPRRARRPRRPRPRPVRGAAGRDRRRSRPRDVRGRPAGVRGVRGVTSPGRWAPIR